MNNDLISRKALLEAYDKAHKGPPGGARKLIEEAPGVDAVEVGHGRWELTAHNQIVNGRRSVTAQCSECGEDKGEIWAGFFPGIPDYIADSVALQSAESVKLSNFCPNCGAKMDGGTGR